MSKPTKKEIKDVLYAMNLLGEHEYVIYGVKASTLRMVSRHLRDQINQTNQKYARKKESKETSKESSDQTSSESL